MIDHTFMIKKMQSAKELFVLFSQPTNMPYVECDEETFDDQVHIFSDETEVQAFAKKYTERKILLTAMKVPQNRMKTIYNTLYSIGVNAILFHENDKVTRLQLTDVVKMPDVNKLMQEKVPVINPPLQLSALYFLEELNRPVEHDKAHLKELEEELIANLLRGKFILPLENAKEGAKWNPKDPNQKSRIPYVKDKKDQLFLPVFSDFTEFQKFYKEKAAAMGMAILPISGLSQHLVKEAKGIMLNPAGFHLMMSREQLERISTVQK